MGTEILYPVMIGLLCTNIIGFAMTGLDKRWAIHGQWRLAEKWFLRVTLLGGGPGVFLGCLLFHHKIRKRSFMLGIPAIFILETGLGILLYICFYRNASF